MGRDRGPAASEGARCFNPIKCFLFGSFPGRGCEKREGGRELSAAAASSPSSSCSCCFQESDREKESGISKVRFFIHVIARFSVLSLNKGQKKNDEEREKRQRQQS